MKTSAELAREAIESTRTHGDMPQASNKTILGLFTVIRELQDRVYALQRSENLYSKNGASEASDIEIWNTGWMYGRMEEEKYNRTLAFGAIRRAAEIAQFYDNSDTYNRCDLSRSSQVTGNVIRKAIRAAIGSEKL